MTSLREICVHITDGKHGDCQDEENSGFYFISCKDVKDGWVDYSGARQITEADFLDTNKRTQLEASDILVTNSGTIGRMALVTNSPDTNHTTFQKSVAIVKPDPEKVVPRWLYYALLANRDALIASAGGTAQKNLLLGDMRAFAVEVPPLVRQRNIAAILSAYDELVENNVRRTRILEEMAQNLYREWFLRFRFPGHEDVHLVDSPLGPIPEGWKVMPLDRLVGLRKDKFNKQRDSEYPLLDLAKMQRGTLSVGETGNPGELTTSRIIFEEDDILFGSIRPYLRKVALVPWRGVTNVSVLVLRAAEKTLRPFLAILLSSIDTTRWADQHSTGTKMPVIGWDALREMPVLKPSQPILSAYWDNVQPMLETIKMMSSRNRNLRRTRDLLLPRLISGEVDVSELDIAVPEGAEA